MGDDWLQHGHETDDVELTRVLSSSSAVADGASPPPRFPSGWRGVVIGGAIAVAATLGVVGVANAISDNLFPSLGATTPASVWQNPVPPDEPVPDADVTPTTTSPASTPAIAPTTTQAAPSSTVAAPALSPTTSTPTREADADVDGDVDGNDDGDVATTTLPSTQADDDEPDDTEPDDIGSDDAGSSGSGDSSGSGSSGSGSSGTGSSGSDDSGSGSDDD